MEIIRKALALILAGSLFFSYPVALAEERVAFSVQAGAVFSGRVKRGVRVNGVEVGGMGYAEAVEFVREEIAKSLPPFTVVTPDGGETFTYPQISFTDDVPALVRRARAGETLTARVVRQWAGAEEEIGRLCEQNALAPKNAEVIFSANGFRYLKERAGRSCDFQASLLCALADLKAGKSHTVLVFRAETPEQTVESLRERTRLLASFKTYFDASKINRVHNLRLAAERVTGTFVPPRGTFSFNRTVGKRTKENGFREAAVIFDGEFVQGVGGGVCQASTTLFNAALLAGLNVTESRPHSLSVSYVKPSLDAMVSEYSDLKFENPFGTGVYLALRVEGNAITASVYGKRTGLSYRTESVVLSRVSPPPERVVEGEEDTLLRAEKAGLTSESYRLTYFADGSLFSRELIRRDAYAVVQGIRQQKKTQAESENSQEIGENFTNQE